MQLAAQRRLVVAVRRIAAEKGVMAKAVAPVILGHKTKSRVPSSQRAAEDRPSAVGAIVAAGRFA